MSLSPGTNRREFLKRSLLASTTALTMPCFVPRDALGSAGTPGTNTLLDRPRREGWELPDIG